jgi:hypothetical protein
MTAHHYSIASLIIHLIVWWVLLGAHEFNSAGSLLGTQLNALVARYISFKCHPLPMTYTPTHHIINDLNNHHSVLTTEYLLIVSLEDLLNLLAYTAFIHNEHTTWSHSKDPNSTLILPCL